MTDLAIPDDRHDDRAPAVSNPGPSDGANALMQWAQQADLAYQMAHKLASTSFVPASLRGKPGDVTAAILAGQEMGMRPMAALRSMDIIQGTPALRAHAMRGLVQSHGHHVQLVESTPARCVMRGRRKGEDTWQTVEWTIERARMLGLTGKDQWKKQPATMLIARATGEICRLIASDVLHAMPYAAEELRSADEGEAEIVPDAPRVTAAEILGRPAPAPAPTPEQASAWQAEDAEDDTADIVEDAPDGGWSAVAQPGGAA